MAPTFTNGHNGVHHDADEQIDSLYAWFPPQPPAPQPCPEALFSLTLKGKLDGIETLLTVRGMTAEEFRRNLQQVRGLLDQSQPVPAARPRESGPVQEIGWCQKHNCEMTLNTKNGRSWWSHRTADGWCKGK